MKKIKLEVYQMENFKVSHILLAKENKCFLFGYLPTGKRSFDQRMMLLCWQETLNDFLVNIEEKSGRLIKAISDEVQGWDEKEEIVIEIKEILKRETLHVKNLTILAEELEEREEGDDVVRGFIQEIIVKQ